MFRRTKENLYKHRISVHEGIKYPCGQCEYQATRKDNLDQHKRSVHKEIKKYTCGNVSINNNKR